MIFTGEYTVCTVYPLSGTPSPMIGIEIGKMVKLGKMSSIKVMVAFGQQTFELLDGEAKERGVTVQELLRAVIIPDWFRTHAELLTKITMPEAGKRIEPLTKVEPSLDQGSKFHSNRLYLV
jgi:hypothetical protein